VTIRDAILATIDAEESREIVGRTLLQKKLYFLSVLAGEDFGFYPYFYGPYSSSVSDDLGTLIEAGFVKDDIDVFPGSTSRFGERRRYSYRLTEEGKRVLQSKRFAIREYSAYLERINAHPVVSDPNLLPVAAKVHFIVTERGRASVDEIRERASELGWELSKADIDQVVNYLRHLELVAGER
jgi:uncharacterized protein YwgA